MGLKSLLKVYWQDDSGATAIEYAIVISVISIIVISSLVIVGGHTTNTWNTVGNAVD